MTVQVKFVWSIARITVSFTVFIVLQFFNYIVSSFVFAILLLTESHNPKLTEVLRTCISLNLFSILTQMSKTLTSFVFLLPQQCMDFSSFFGTIITFVLQSFQRQRAVF
jgi:hypothetical protein